MVYDDGIYIDCNFNQGFNCDALTELYNDGMDCVGCPFFKTPEQVAADKLRYKRK